MAGRREKNDAIAVFYRCVFGKRILGKRSVRRAESMCWRLCSVVVVALVVALVVVVVYGSGPCHVGAGSLWPVRCQETELAQHRY